MVEGDRFEHSSHNRSAVLRVPLSGRQRSHGIEVRYTHASACRPSQCRLGHGHIANDKDLEVTRSSPCVQNGVSQSRPAICADGNRELHAVDIFRDEGIVTVFDFPASLQEVLYDDDSNIVPLLVVA